MTVATTDESTITLKLRVPKRRSRTSRAKNTPAIGALKIPATPPAAPARRQEVGDGSDEQPADDGNQDQPRARQPVVLHDVEEEAVAEFHEHRGADGGQSGAQPHDCSEHHRPATR